MSIASKITQLTTDISNAYDAIEAKGGMIPANKNTNNLDTAIESIPTGSQPTLITKNITANGDYSAADDNADGYSEVSVNIDDSVPWDGWRKDGNTHLWIEVDEFTRNLKQGLGLFVLDITRPITIYWGDGTSDIMAMPQYKNTLVKTVHNYANSGKYCIDIIGGVFRFSGDSTSGGGSRIFGNGIDYEEAELYILHYCEFGTNISNPNDMQHAFYKCYNLKNIYNSGGLDSMTVVPAGMFSTCRSLTAMIDLSNITRMNDSCFFDAKFSNVFIPKNVVTYNGYSQFGRTNIKKVEFETPLEVKVALARRQFYESISLYEINIPYNAESVGAQFIDRGRHLSGAIHFPNTIKNYAAQAFGECYWDVWDFKDYTENNGLIVNSDGETVSFGSNCFGSKDNAKFIFANPSVAKIAENTTNLTTYSAKIYGHIDLNGTYRLDYTPSGAITVNSSDRSVCDVSYAYNIVTFSGVSEGSAYITITDDNGSMEYKVVVE